MPCHRHMNMCCVFKLHVDMSTLFKRLLTKNQMSMQIVRMEKSLLHLIVENNYGVILILYMIFNLLFILFYLYFYRS
jgi:hypothetical protein